MFTELNTYNLRGLQNPCAECGHEILRIREKWQEYFTRIRKWQLAARFFSTTPHEPLCYFGGLRGARGDWGPMPAGQS